MAQNVNNTMLSPEAQDEMLKTRKASEIVQVISDLVKNGTWLKSEVLCWVVNNFKMFTHPLGVMILNFIKGIFGKKQPHPAVKLLLEYRQKHPDEPWPKDFITAVVHSPHFIELYNTLQLEDLLSHEDKCYLIDRKDSLCILQNCELNLEFTIQQAMLCSEDFVEKFVAYASVSHDIAKVIFDDVLSCQHITEKQIATLLAGIKPEKRVGLFHVPQDSKLVANPVLDPLLMNRNYAITKEIVGYLQDWNEDRLKYVMTTKHGGLLVGRIIDHILVDILPSMQGRIFDILPRDKDFISRIEKMLGNAGKELAAKLATLPENQLKEIYWPFAVKNDQLWIALLDTPISLFAMKSYKDITVNDRKNSNSPSIKVLKKMVLLCPNASELVALFERGVGRRSQGMGMPIIYDSYPYDFPKEVIEAIKVSPYLNEIKKTATESLLKKLEE